MIPSAADPALEARWCFHAFMWAAPSADQNPFKREAKSLPRTCSRPPRCSSTHDPPPLNPPTPRQVTADNCAFTSRTRASVAVRDPGSSLVLRGGTVSHGFDATPHPQPQPHTPNPVFLSPLRCFGVRLPDPRANLEPNHARPYVGISVYKSF